MLTLRKIGVGMLVCALATGIAHAETVKLVANLQPSSEVPPTTSRGRARSTRLTIPPPARCAGTRRIAI